MMDIPASAKYAIIQETSQRADNLLSIKQLCSLASVSRSGYYRYFQGYAKGARGIYMRLIHMDPPIVMNIKRIRRLMRKYGLKCPIRKANPYHRMAKALKTSYVAPNLLNREFETHGPLGRSWILDSGIIILCFLSCSLSDTTIAGSVFRPCGGQAAGV